jgi:hypothetical protein
LSPLFFSGTGARSTKEEGLTLASLHGELVVNPREDKLSQRGYSTLLWQLLHAMDKEDSMGKAQIPAEKNEQYIY